MESPLSSFQTILLLGVLVSCFSSVASICTPGVMRTGTNCNTYYYCEVNQQETLLSCQNHLVFNPAKQACDYPQNVPGCGGTSGVILQNPCYPTNPCGIGQCRQVSTYGVGLRYQCYCPNGITQSTACVSGSVISSYACQPSPCQFGGTCIVNSAYNARGNPAYYCICKTGYTGQRCESVIDKCTPNPCGLGSCSVSGSSYVCTCPSYRRGAHCQLDANSCLVSPCLNGGSCARYVNQYRCMCPYGYSGTRCEVRSQFTVQSSCYPNPCGTGRCQQISTYSHQCICPNGLTQRTPCSSVAVLNPCYPNPCGIGRCQQISTFSVGQRFRCICPNGVTQSTACYTATAQSPCYPNPCGSGRCQPLGTYGYGQQYQCTCPNGLTQRTACLSSVQNRCFPNPCGYNRRCQVSSFNALGYVCLQQTTASGACLVNPCGQGQCQVSFSSPTGYLCRCFDTLRYQTSPCTTGTSVWTGVINRCTINPCLNGECIPSSNVAGYTCRCPVGFTGKDCHTDINECALNPCGPGICHNTRGGYSCDCGLSGYEGKMCNIPISIIGKKKKK